MYVYIDVYIRVIQNETRSKRILAPKGSSIIWHYTPPTAGRIWQPRRSLYMAWKPFPLYRHEPSLIWLTFHRTGAKLWIMSINEVFSCFLSIPQWIFVCDFGTLLCFGHPTRLSAFCIAPRRRLDASETPLGLQSHQNPGRIFGGFKVWDVWVYAEPIFEHEN